jgi:hypothetical protein
MLMLMLIGLILFAGIVSSEIILNRKTTPHIMYVQSDESQSFSYTPAVLLGAFIFIIINLMIH